MPLGDMTGTLISLINANCRIDFSYNYSVMTKSGFRLIQGSSEPYSAVFR